MNLWRAVRDERRSYDANLVVRGAVRPAGGGWRAPVDLSAADQNACRLWLRALRALRRDWREQGPDRRFMPRSRPSVAVDSRGNAVAVWQRVSRDTLVVQGAVRPAGGDWQPPVDLSAADRDASDAQIALDEQGNAVVVWLGCNGADLIVQGTVRPAGGAWRAPVDLSAADQNAFLPQIAVDSQGNAVAVWRVSHGRRRAKRVNLIVQAAARPAGGVWQAPVDLFAVDKQRNPPQLFDSNPSVAVDPQGNAVVVWVRVKESTKFWDPLRCIVQGAVRPAGGVWQAPVDLAAACHPRVAVDSQGNAIGVWVGVKEGATFWEGSESMVQGAVRLASGAWQPPVDLSAADQGASDPHVALDSQGNAIAVWASGTTVQSAVRQAGGLWQAPVELCAATASSSQRRRIQGRSGPPAFHPRVAVDPQGNAIAVWTLPSATNLIVQRAERRAGGNWQAPVDVSAADQDAFEPQIAAGSQGDAVAVWLETKLQPGAGRSTGGRCAQLGWA